MAVRDVIMAAAGIDSTGAASSDPYFSNVALLLHMDGANGGTTFTDSSQYARTMTRVGTALTTSNTQTKIGSTAAQVTAGSSYLTTPAFWSLFGSSDYTIEGWVYKPTGTHAIGLIGNDGGSSAITLQISGNGGRIDWLQSSDGSTFTLSLSTADGALPRDQWVHLRFVRVGTIYTIYINGVSAATDPNGPSGAVFATGGTFRFGVGAVGMTAYFDEWRVTPGIARCFGNFTVPTAAFPDTGPAGAYASGGTVTTSGGYTIHTFTSGSSTLLTYGRLTGDYLVVGGGGGGGSAATLMGGAGGGGGGGVLTGSNYVFGATSLTATVGGGGSGAPTSGSANNGSNSVLGTITATGGGAGASWLSGGGAVGSAGGSGGGNAGDQASFGNGTGGQGSRGGDGISSGGTPYGGGGGGGAGAVGGDGVMSTRAGHGGDGIASSISGASVYYGGGGGGGTYRGTSGMKGLGGQGGGGNGYDAGQTPQNGTANTGGGGGGGGESAAPTLYAGGNGGSGIVIVRYQTPTTLYATWNPSDKSGNITLSGGNLTSTPSGTGSVRATSSKTTGKHYWEVTINGAGTYNSVGFGTAAATLTQVPGNAATSYGYWNDGSVKNNTALAATYATFTTNDVLGVALDLDNGDAYFYKNNVLQGKAFTGLSGIFFPMHGGTTASAGVTANFGQNPLKYTPPNGTFWNPKDAGANVTLSNNNMTAANAAAGSVRSNTSKSSGKWYFEVRLGASPSTAVGIGKSGASLATYCGGDANGWSRYTGGTQKYNNNTGTAYGTAYPSNSVIGVAFDATAGTLEFYKNGVSEGVAFTGLSGTFFAMTGAGGSDTANTLNTGATPFAYTPPSGYSAWDATVYNAGVY